MTDQEINIAIAEYFGWHRIDPFKCGRETVDWPVWAKEGHSNRSFKTNTMTDFCGDLNQMRIVEVLLNDQEQADYADHLYHDLPALENVGPMDTSDPDSPDVMICSFFTLCHASARHRAIAFLKVKGLLPLEYGRSNTSPSPAPRATNSEPAG